MIYPFFYSSLSDDKKWLKKIDEINAVFLRNESENLPLIQEGSRNLAWLSGEFDFLYYREIDTESVNIKIQLMLSTLEKLIPPPHLKSELHWENAMVLDQIMINLHPLTLTMQEEYIMEADYDNEKTTITVALPEPERTHNMKINKWRARCVKEIGKNLPFNQLIKNYIENGSDKPLSRATKKILASVTAKNTDNCFFCMF